MFANGLGMVSNLKTDKMKEYLENRIKELKESDARACEKRWDMSRPEFERNMWRENSNEITGRRRELEDALKFLNN